MNKDLTFTIVDDFIVSKTDIGGRIIYFNDIFLSLSGYSFDELLNTPHKILRHPDMPSVIFKMLWDEIKAGREILAYVKNKTKDNDFYWVFAQVTPSYDLSGNIIGFHSVRRQPTKQSLDIIIPMYKKILQEEKTKGINASNVLLNSILKEKGLSYAEFITSI